MNFFKLLLLIIPFYISGQKNSLNQKISEIIKDKNATVGVSVLGIDFPFSYNNANKK